MFAKIADLGFLASRFPTLTVFAASVPSLFFGQFFGQFFLFVPEDGFFFFGHRIIKLGIIVGVKIGHDGIDVQKSLEKLNLGQNFKSRKN